MLHGAGSRTKVTPSVSATSSTTSESMRSRGRRGRGCSCCGHLTGAWISFLFLTLVLVPTIVFLLAMLFASFLWRIECDAAGGSGAQSGCDPTQSATGCPCLYYQWVLYIIGNLVGLGTPLTNNTPSSRHALAELVDLLVSMWSISLAGTFYGVYAHGCRAHGPRAHTFLCTPIQHRSTCTQGSSAASR